MLKGGAALTGRVGLMIDALLSVSLKLQLKLNKDKSFCPVGTVPNMGPDEVTGLSPS